jgi:beta-lactam-binding protein with PASTA domain
MNFFKFIFSKWFVVNILLAVVLLILGMYATLGLLEKVTLHGQTIKVPDLKSYSLDEVDEALSTLSLDYRVIDSSAYSTRFPKRSVVKQDPTSGSEVKEGRVIYLTVNPSGFRSMQVPKLIGKTSREAVSYLKSIGFKVGKFEYRPDIGKNVVLDLKYKGEILDTLATLPKQSVIDLVLGAGIRNEKTFTPNLAGDNLDVAKRKLLELSLNLGKVRYDEEKDDDVNYFVYRHYPKYDDNRRLRMGSVVDLWMTSDSLKLPKIESDTLEIGNSY